MSRRDTPSKTPQTTPPLELAADEIGALQVGPTDRGMVRLILVTRAGVVELDYEPEEAEEIADELRTAANVARGRSR